MMHTPGLTDKSKLKKYEIAVLVVSAIVTITFVSTSSPLYPYNPWDDTNVFFTLGRGIIHGLVPYKDIFDHKGPLLYFIYALATLLSEKSFIGVWIIECIAAAVYAIYSWKTVKLFTDPSKFSLVLLPLFLGVVYTNKMFNFGGNTEELCFPLLTIVLYIALRSVVFSDGLPSNIATFLCGIISGSLFWLKYTFLGFIIGYCIFILFLLIKRKSFAKLGTLIGIFIGGFLTITIPLLLYFCVNGALGYLWEAYFYDNIFLYHTENEINNFFTTPVIRYFAIPLRSICYTAIFFPSFGSMLLLTLSSMIFVKKDHRKKTYLLFFLTLSLSAGCIFTRLEFIYYYGFLLYYCFGLALLPLVICWNSIEKVFKQNIIFIRVLLSFILIVFYSVSILLCKNMYLIFKPKQFLAQYRFAETINQTPNAKILTYDVMDAGFYTVANVMPSNRYCADKMFGDSYPQLREEQDRLIEQGYFDYIITSYFCDEKWDNYELIQEEAIPYVDFTGEEILDAYKLYKKI
ncbi:MAG: glycosyltransferase family 39 protein [Saccharofermentans sp.]|nr:glycosyltransferase family 39 protein [Saccharofermentans sp.]